MYAALESGSIGDVFFERELENFENESTVDLNVTLEKTVDGKSTLDENYIPDHSAVTESDVSQAQDYVMEKCIENAQDQQSSIINDRKFIVFESELDKLLTKLICPTEDCFCIIQSLDKVIVGSLLKVYGTCPDHHHQIIWQSQPDIANCASGNVLPSSTSSIVCSGSSFTKAKEMLDLVNIQFFFFLHIFK